MKKILLPLLCLFLFIQCKDEPGDGGDGTPSCDTSLRPVVMVHGFLGSGDTYELQFQRFESNGYCPDRLYVLNWNSLAFGSDATAELDALIDRVLQETGTAQVDLAGHSAGSSTAYAYLGDAARAAKVAHYVHIGGSPEATPAGPEGEVPTLNIWSTEDYVVTGGDIPNATNFMNAGKDHYEVATSVESFEKMYQFFNDNESPSTLDINPQDEVEVSGTVLTFGENQAVAGATILIHELNLGTGYHSPAAPIEASSDGDGNYGPVTLRSGVEYEFEVIPNNGTRKVHYFREPFTRSNQLVLLRTLPAGGLGNILLGSLPEDNGQSVIAFYSGSKAVISGRDILSVDGHVLSTPEFAAAENATIAMFYYDGNNNQNTDLSPIGGTWDLVPTFLEAVDMYFPTNIGTSITVELNGKQIVLPNLPSGSAGVMVAQFY